MDRQAPAGSGSRAALGLDQPNAARMYDYLLSGSANFAVDRDAAQKLVTAVPDMPFGVQCNRAFLDRAVRYLAGEVGIDQFLDLGSGVPTVGNVHEVAHHENPAARVAYVDFEPVAVEYSRQLLADTDRATITQADMRETDTVLAADGVAGLLDFTRPIALLTVGVLHYLTDDTECQRTMAAYQAALPAGSYCVLSHVAVTDPSQPLQAANQIMSRTATPSCDRTPEQIHALLEGYTLLEPGLVPTPAWRPETPPTERSLHRCNNYGAVGYLP